MAAFQNPDQPSPAEVAANVSVDLIAYPSPDRVQFGGHGTAGQFIRLYLDNAALGEPITIAAGTNDYAGGTPVKLLGWGKTVEGGINFTF